MHIVTTTDAARHTYEQHQKYSRTVAPHGLFPAYLGVMTTFPLMSIGAVVYGESFVNFLLNTPVAEVAALVNAVFVTLLFKLWDAKVARRRRRIEAAYQRLCAAGEIAEIDDVFMDMWAVARDEAEIPADEPRAKIGNFPEVIGEICRMSDAYFSDMSRRNGRYLRREARKLLRQLMLEALQPLAVEYEARRAEDDRIQGMNSEVNTDDRRAQRTANAVHLDHLIRI